MSVMISDDKKDLIVTCKCGCQDSIHIKVNDEDKDADYYAIQTYMSGNWYREMDCIDNLILMKCLRSTRIWRILL